MFGIVLIAFSAGQVCFQLILQLISAFGAAAATYNPTKNAVLIGNENRTGGAWLALPASGSNSAPCCKLVEINGFAQGVSRCWLVQTDSSIS